MPTYQASTDLARRNTLRSIPLIRPAAVVYGHDAAFRADWALQIARRDLAIHEAYLPHAYAALGSANKVRGPMRRTWQVQGVPRDQHGARGHPQSPQGGAAAEAAMLAFAPAVAA